MAPGKKSPTAKPRAAKAKPTKGKKAKDSTSTVKAAPKRPIHQHVLDYAKKRGIQVADEDSNDDGTNKPPKKRPKRKRSQALAYDDLVPLEMPPPRDFGATFAAKSTAHFTWGAPSVARPTDQQYTRDDRGSASSSKGKGEQVASPSSSEGKGKQVASPSNNKGKGKQIASPSSSKGKGKQVASPSDDLALIDLIIGAPHSRTMTPDEDAGSDFLRLPTEIRNKIYKLILVADHPVRVQQGWSTVYPRTRPRVTTPILRVSKMVRREATNVLYGENTFLYLLRETASPPVDKEIVVQHPLAVVDDQLSEHSDDEYNCDDLAVEFNHNTEVDIDIPRVGHKFRHIVIVAEPNRSETGYLHSMANAINVFSQLKPIRPRIHTITIEITPTRDPDTGEVTFVNFFEKTSVVMKALRGLPCQYINVVVKAGQEEKTFTINMTHAAILRRARRGESDIWRGDHVVQMNRNARAGEAQEKLVRLPADIRDFFESQNPESEWTDEEDDGDDDDTF
ncbi:hypothetical protein CPLU01_05172 [Colletotrichum plurivorum]|uniref:Uncharacterized protein n=1 Tax=Colletotrichum plurivorum TaxID=2175906 RepID=A0A8H6KM21_9PEZI|nr:hypothetical protein CPLU01_05172 [Colletotrichum plurivorum]